MKKAVLAFIFIMTALGVFAQNSGIIRELAGIVELKAPGSSNFVPAKVGDSVSQDTIVSTGFKSAALIEVGSTVLNVRALTRLSLTEIAASAGTETLNVNLQTGRVRVDVNPPAGVNASTNVSSPVATASVRGTSFEFDIQNLVVYEGTVSYMGNNGQQIMVSEGSDSRVESNGRTADPIATGMVKLLPPSPVGAYSVRSSVVVGRPGDNGTANANGTIVIELNWNTATNP